MTHASDLKRPGDENNGTMATPAASSNNANRELLGPSGWPSMGHSPSEYSGILMGGGPVNVSTVNTSFSGGTLIHNHNPSERIRPGLKLLQNHVATSAFHNSAQRVDPPRCHPDTRVAIQKQIHNWILMDILVRKMWIMWMHGAAGAGKSAIMQSIAELCETAQIPLASFFFLRTDPARNTTTSFIATLVYQLIQVIPQVQDEIFEIIENNPLIFTQPLKSQFDQLIIHPLVRVQEHFKGFFVILIDGLDEYTERAHQIDFIQLLGAVSRSRRIPVVFLVASRREPQIEAAFAHKGVSDLVLTLPLDNSDIEKTSDDIRHFLVDKFRDIKETHLLKRYLPIDWPPVSYIEEIISQSSGQFIFASAVINYLSFPRANPAHQLEVIHGIRLRDPSSLNPFAHLDALYQHIFSQVEALDKVLDILAYILITKTDSLTSIEDAFLLERSELDRCLADLTAVIKYEFDSSGRFGKIKLLHASLPDFLLDKTRSGPYHIDVGVYRTKLACFMLEKPPPTIDPLSSTDDLLAVSMEEIYALERILIFLEGAESSDRLRQAFIKFDITFYDADIAKKAVDVFVKVLECLDKQEFDPERGVYRHLAYVFAPYFTTHWQDMDDDRRKEIARKYPELTNHIDQNLQKRKPMH